MKIEYVHEGVAMTAIIEPAECRISDTESRVWTEEEFQQKFLPNNAAARKAYQAYRRTYSPAPDTEAGHFVELLRQGKLLELEREYKSWITPSGDGGFDVHFTRRKQHTKKKKTIKMRKKDSRSSRKRKKRKGHAPPWLLYTPFETNRRRH